MTDMELRLLGLYARGVTAAKVQAMLDEDTQSMREAARPMDDLPGTLMEEAERLGAQLVTRASEDYPPSLLNIPDPPIALYAKGNLRVPMERVVAAAGSRAITAYGAMVAKELGHMCAQNGVTLVCGLSEGVDAVAARSCLDSGGWVIGVLVTGINVVYPRDFSELFERVAQHGMLITEFRPGARPYNALFSARNRLISGLADAVVLVEARGRSGALFTIEHALEQGKEVFAVPGNIDSPMSEAPNTLLKQGANILLKPVDLLEHMGWQKTAEAIEGTGPLSVEEALVVRALRDEPLEYDKLAAACAITASKLNSLLTRLEMRGIIVQSAGRRYALAGIKQ